MKKLFSILILSLLTFSLTGCKTKTENTTLELTCIKNQEKIVLNYENNKLVKQYTELTQTYENEFLFSTAYKATEMSIQSYNAINGITAEFTYDNKSITTKVTYDIKLMNEENLKGYELDDKQPNELIQQAESTGYTCTTK